MENSGFRDQIQNHDSADLARDISPVRIAIPGTSPIGPSLPPIPQSRETFIAEFAFFLTAIAGRGEAENPSVL